jgi:transcriptional regulator with XRE-family HTH domain
MSFGQIIFDARNRKGWRQADVAERIGRDHTFIAHLEKETQVPSKEIVTLLTQVLELTSTQSNELALSAELARRARDEEKEVKRQEREKKKSELRMNLAPLPTTTRQMPVTNQITGVKSATTTPVASSGDTSTLLTKEDIMGLLADDEEFFDFVQKITFAYDHPDLEPLVKGVINLVKKNLEAE